MLDLEPGELSSISLTYQHPASGSESHQHTPQPTPWLPTVGPWPFQDPAYFRVAGGLHILPAIHSHTSPSPESFCAPSFTKSHCCPPGPLDLDSASFPRLVTLPPLIALLQTY